jgi:hypothetical protein
VFTPIAQSLHRDLYFDHKLRPSRLNGLDAADVSRRRRACAIRVGADASPLIEEHDQRQRAGLSAAGAVSKEHEVHKKAKKKPVLNPKERRLIKQAKKRARAVM